MSQTDIFSILTQDGEFCAAIFQDFALFSFHETFFVFGLFLYFGFRSACLTARMAINHYYYSV